MGRAEYPDSCGTTSHGLGPSGFFVFLDHRTESEHCFWLGTWITEMRTVLLAGVLEQVDAAVCQDRRCSSKGLRFTLRDSFFTGPRPPSPVVFRACHDSHHERTTIPKKRLFEWIWVLHSTRQRILARELLTLRSLVDRNQWLAR